MNTLIFKKDETLSRPILFLHGFPGVRSKQNRDVAEQVAHALGRVCYVPLYDGLGHSPGVFSFKECRENVVQLADHILKNHQSSGDGIDVVGHSWGGYLALVLAARLQTRVRKMVLMSPLLKLLRSNEIDLAIVNGVRENTDLSLANNEKLMQDFIEMGVDSSPFQLIEKLSPHTEVLILQAKDDNITPTDIAVEALEHFSHEPRFEIVETDHGFLSDRITPAKKIAGFLGP